MTWIPPFFRCGECGGEIGRWPTVNLLRQEIFDWRHRTVPDGVGEHRAVLGTPAHRPQVAELTPPTESELEALLDHAAGRVPPPEEVARPALAGDLPSSAALLDRLAESNGWLVEAWTWRGTLMDARWKASRVRSTVCLRFLRDGHGLVALWVEDSGQAWKFDEAYSVGHYVTALSSPQLRKALSQPRALCERCGETPALHVSTNTGPVCHADWVIHEGAA